MTELLEFLAWAAAPGAVIIASLLLDRWKNFNEFDKLGKRIISLSLTGVIGLGATLILLYIGVLMEKVEIPVGVIAWIALVADAIARAVGVGLLRHTTTMFKKK